MKKLFVLICFIFLCGCTDITYSRSNERANIYIVNMDEINKKIEQEDTFMFMLGREDCSSCLWVQEEVLYDYLLNHGFDFYKVELTNDETHPESIKAIEFIAKNPNPEEFLFDQYLPTDVLTPSFYFIENGKVEDIYIGSGLTVEIFDGLIQKYRLDEVK